MRDRVGLIVLWKGEILVSYVLYFIILLLKTYGRVFIVQINKFPLVLKHFPFRVGIDIHHQVVLVLFRLHLVLRYQFIKLLKLFIVVFFLLHQGGLPGSLITLRVLVGT